jgi:hypothetical protein
LWNQYRGWIYSNFFFKNQSRKFFLKGKNYPTLIYFMWITNFWPLHLIRRLFYWFLKHFFQNYL